VIILRIDLVNYRTVTRIQQSDRIWKLLWLEFQEIEGLSCYTTLGNLFLGSKVEWINNLGDMVLVGWRIVK